MSVPKHITDIVEGVLRPLGYTIEDLTKDAIDCETLSRTEVKGILKVSDTALYRYCEAGYLKPTKLGIGGSGRVLFRKADVLRFLREGAAGGVAK